MPYQLEKGPLLRVIERHVNGDRATVQQRLDSLRANIADPRVWLGLNNALWADPSLLKQPPGMEPPMERILREWFGYRKRPDGTWDLPDATRPTTGYWIGYKGDVSGVVGRALAWAMELALANGGASASPPLDPWPIELFWKCPANWFEAWVVARRDEGRSSGRITLTFISPSHEHGVVAMSPIATHPVASPPGSVHPVPSWQDDYELLGQPHPVDPQRPRVAAVDRPHAMWVVSQRSHTVFNGAVDVAGPGPARRDDRDRQEDTTAARRIGDFEIAQLARYEGRGDVVVVSPSMAAGGVKYDGEV